MPVSLTGMFRRYHKITGQVTSNSAVVAWMGYCRGIPSLHAARFPGPWWWLILKLHVTEGLSVLISPGKNKTYVTLFFSFFMG